MTDYILSSKLLGEGGYGAAYVATDPTSSKKYAVKVFNQNVVNKDDPMVQIEFALADKINHANCLSIVDKGQAVLDIPAEGTSRNAIYTVSELYQHGELFDMIVEAGGFDDKTARYFFKQFIAGLSYLHSEAGVAHRDLKGENVLLNGTVIKLIDFGMAKDVGAPDSGHNPVGTQGYQPPEYLDKQNFNGDKFDVFSAGVILFQMLAANNPFGEANYHTDRHFKTLIKSPEKYWKFQEKQTCKSFSPDAVALVSSMLARDPADRPTCEQVINSTWLNGPVATSEEVAAMMANVIVERDGKGVEFEEAYQEIMDALAEDEGTSRAFGDDGALPQEIAFDEVHKTSFVCNYPPEQLATLVENYCKENEITHETDEPSYVIDIEHPIEVAVPNLNEETDEIEEEEETITVSLKMQVFSVKDKEGCFCVQFTKTKGNLINFHKAYSVYRDEVLAPAIMTHKLA